MVYYVPYPYGYIQTPNIYLWVAKDWFVDRSGLDVEMNDQRTNDLIDITSVFPKFQWPITKILMLTVVCVICDQKLIFHKV